MLIFLTLLFLQWLSLSALNTVGRKPQLVVILLDGVRWDYFKYFDLTDLPGYRQFFVSGVNAEYMETVFPSDSFPSWTTLQTGLYPESHGILGNFVFDKEKGETIFINDHEWSEKWWQDAEPIWITAKKHGLRVATYQWNNANVPYNGMLPNVASGFQSKNSTSLHNKIQHTKKMLKIGFDLILLYHGDADKMGHDFGPTDSKVKQEMEFIGEHINDLFTFIQSSSVSKELGDVQIILVSDHGITDVCYPLTSHFIHVNAIRLPPNPLFGNKLKKIFYTPVKHSFVHKSAAHIQVYTDPENAQKLFRRLRHVRGYSTFLKHNIPEELHYKKGKYAPDLIMIDGMKSSILKHCGGRHGFNPKYSDMRTIFLAWGSAFIAPQIHPPMHIVDVYQIMCHVLRIKPMPHNGTWDRIRLMLNPEYPLFRSTAFEHN